ncbi:MAG: FecR domain-containing protein [Dysgonamonadaceae bacterium]|jgi:ferric-dicitrate binding protein FerR (iron transport regulator)|nr:FecR domain-containing protein [Dysgonamonadaceae bacterium]
MEEILIKYLQNNCSEEDLKRLNQWLSEQNGNKRDFFSSVALLKSGHLKRYSDPDFIQKEKIKLQERICKEKANMKRRKNLKQFLQYAAVTVITVSIAMGIYRLFVSDSMQTLTTSQGEIKQIVLFDGTKILLNESAKLEYPENFGKKYRTVYFEGEGYFEVAEDTIRPFIVKTQNLEIEVLGTKFNLNCVRDRSVSVVTLLEGEVKVKGNKGEGMIILSPGQKAELDLLTRKLRVRESKNALLETIWHDGLIPFHQASIKDIGKILEQLYHVKVHIDADVSQTTYSGVLKNQDSINTILRLLKYSIPIEYEIRENDVYIRSKD